jgi:DNA-binding transcriptional LysR family regulator
VSPTDDGPRVHLDIRHFRAFVAVAEHGTVSAAARALHISQPGLSDQIVTLERHVGRSLFTRLPGSRGMELTAAGRRLLGHARHVLSLLAATPRLLADDVRPLSLGVPIAVPTDVMAELAQVIAAHAPAGVAPRPSRTSDSVSALMTGGLDMALVRMPVNAPTLRMCIVVEQRLGLWVPAGHPFTELTEVPPALLDDIPVSVVERAAAPGFFDTVLAALAARGARPRWIQLPAQDTGFPIRAMTQAVHLTVTAPAPAFEGLVLRPLAGPPLAMHTALAWHEAAPDWVARCAEHAVAALSAGRAAGSTHRPGR